MLNCNLWLLGQTQHNTDRMGDNLKVLFHQKPPEQLQCFFATSVSGCPNRKMCSDVEDVLTHRSSSEWSILDILEKHCTSSTSSSSGWVCIRFSHHTSGGSGSDTSMWCRGSQTRTSRPTIVLVFHLSLPHSLPLHPHLRWSLPAPKWKKQTWYWQN